MRSDEVVLDDVKIDAILGWAVNTRNAEMRRGNKRDGAKVGLACALQDACLAYIDRVETEQEAARLRDKVSWLKRELLVREVLLDLRPTQEDEKPTTPGCVEPART